ncbi:MAG: hypothetical protein HKN13_04000, partial [Rhodothermales bacterium]|nr:hypothetical protein [Rhodothermales bacterium]
MAIGNTDVSRETVFSISEKIWTGQEYAQLEQALTGIDAGDFVSVHGAAGSLKSFIVAGIARQASGCLLCVLPYAEDAAYLASDLAEIAPEDNILLLPPSGDDPYDPERLPDSEQAIARNDVLQAIISGVDAIVVASVEALVEKTPSERTIIDSSLKLAVGMELPPSRIVENLIELGFSRVDFVQEPGELAVRGGIVDIFPYAGSFPIRFEFFGDEIDSIREFDPASQRSVSRLDEKLILPNLHDAEGGLESILSIIPRDSRLVVFDESTIAGHAEPVLDRATKHFEVAR